MDRQTHSLSPFLPPFILPSLPPFLLPFSSRFLWYESLVFVFFSDQVSNAAWLAWNSSRGWSCLQTHRRIVCFCLPIFSFKAWLVLLTMMVSSSIHFPTNDTVRLSFVAEYTSSVCVHIFCMHSSADVHVGWFHNSASVTSTAVHKGVYFLHGRFRFLRYISRSDTACILNYCSWFFDWSSENICHSVFQYVISVSPLWRKQ